MTIYKLLIDSPLYEKKLLEIKRLAKREKKQLELTGQEITFNATIRHDYKMPDHKQVTGSGVIIRLI